VILLLSAATAGARGLPPPPGSWCPWPNMVFFRRRLKWGKKLEQPYIIPSRHLHRLSTLQNAMGPFKNRNLKYLSKTCGFFGETPNRNSCIPHFHSPLPPGESVCSSEQHLRLFINLFSNAAARYNALLGDVKSYGGCAPPIITSLFLFVKKVLVLVLLLFGPIYDIFSREMTKKPCFL
jgi:hypothetical protein